MKIKFSLIILVTLFLIFLFKTILDPVFLSSGSDALDVSIVPRENSQWIAVALFFLSLVFWLVKTANKTKYLVFLKSLVTAFSLTFVIASGHTYTISGKQHAFIDQWFHIPMSTLALNPDEGVDNLSYKVNELFFSVYDGDELKQKIFLGPFIWGLNKKDLQTTLDKFGVKKNISTN